MSKIPIHDAIVSTDDEDIMAVEQYGFETEYRRPLNLADDYSSLVDTAIHGDWYEKIKNVSLTIF